MAQDYWEWSCSVVKADRLRLYKEVIDDDGIFKPRIVLARGRAKHALSSMHLTREDAEDLVNRLQEVLAGPLGKLVLDLERKR